MGIAPGFVGAIALSSGVVGIAPAVVGRGHCAIALQRSGALSRWSPRAAFPKRGAELLAPLHASARICYIRILGASRCPPCFVTLHSVIWKALMLYVRRLGKGRGVWEAIG